MTTGSQRAINIAAAWLNRQPLQYLLIQHRDMAWLRVLAKRNWLPFASAGRVALDIESKSRQTFSGLRHTLLIAGARGFPPITAPDLHHAILPHNHSRFANPRVIPQKHGDQHTALSIKITLRRARKDKPLINTGCLVRGRQGIQATGHLLPLGCRIDDQAAVKAPRDHRSLAQPEPELGRDGQAPLGVQAVLVLS